MFTVGDVVEITGPNGNGTYDYLWSTRDKYLGMITTIKDINSSGIVSLDGCDGVLFVTDWISHVSEEEEDFDTDISDIIT